MKKIGIYLMIAGIGSILLNQFGYEFRLLMWIDTWGEAVAWGIRGGAVVLGVILLVVGMQQEKSDVTEHTVAE